MGQPGRAKLELVEIPSVAAAADIAAQVLDIAAAERDLIDADANLKRERRVIGSGGQFRQFANDRGGRLARAVRVRHRTVDIDLPSGEHAVEPRMRAECQIGNATEPEAAILRAIEEIDILHERRLCAALILPLSRQG